MQTALVHVLEPIFDQTFHDRSFGFRHGRGCHDALRCVESLLLEGHVYVVEADLKSYFRHCFWNIFEAYDAMIRRRLRRLLLKRNRKNPKRLTRQQRWPNSFFTGQGLYSLREAHERFVQSTGTY